MNGGYLMVSKSDTNLYAKLNNALTVGKPILWYEDANTCYYIDTITKSGTDIILTKGGKTITIESDGTITEVGDIQPHLYKHTFKYYNLRFDIFNDKNSALTENEVKTIIGNEYYQAHGFVTIGTDNIIVDGIYANVFGYYVLGPKLLNNNLAYDSGTQLTGVSFNDFTETITQIF